MSVFLKTVCPRCKNHQTIFSRPSMLVKCAKCNHLLAKTSGGKARMHAKVSGVIKA
ncbi:30S ribosomal protein S27e [Candidatus Pacearchaeota archaeon]|nr:30S ribosomal protein S27e [Candidatus Pacearchaeota archaeon]